MTDQTPRTEAGKRLLANLDYIGTHSQDTSFPMALDDILAIEATAAGVTLLDEERLADAFTWFHIRTQGGCAESHLPDARAYREDSDD